MSKTIAILLGLALVWLTAWWIAAYFTYASGSESFAAAERLSVATTVLEPGAEVRVEGTLMSAPTVKASFSEQPCLAAHTIIRALSRYRDSQDHEWTDSAVVKELRVGPPNLEIAVADKRILLPLDRWESRDRMTENVGVLPDRLGVTTAELDAAKSKLRGTFTGFAVDERTLDGGNPVFIAGQLESGTGPLRLDADRQLGRVELYVGSQANYVRDLMQQGASARTVAKVFTPIGLVPLALLGLVLLLRKRRGAKSA